LREDDSGKVETGEIRATGVSPRRRTTSSPCSIQSSTSPEIVLTDADFIRIMVRLFTLTVKQGGARLAEAATLSPLVPKLQLGNALGSRSSSFGPAPLNATSGLALRPTAWKLELPEQRHSQAGAWERGTVGVVATALWAVAGESRDTLQILQGPSVATAHRAVATTDNVFCHSRRCVQEHTTARIFFSLLLPPLPA
jgi:hypothetical protein